MSNKHLAALNLSNLDNSPSKGSPKSNSPCPSDAENELSADKSLLPACDSCHAKKVKCDRNDPCGNCSDSKNYCGRERPKLRGKPKEKLSTQLGDAVKHINTRMTAIENAVTKLTALTNIHEAPSFLSRNQDTPAEMPCPNSNSATAKRKSLAFGTNPEPISLAASQSSATSATQNAADYQYPNPPFSATEGQNLIRKELDRGARLSKRKRDALQSGLESLKESLNHPYSEHTTLSPVNRKSLDDCPLPSVELVHLLLHRPPDDEIKWSIPDGVPIIPRNTILQMALNLQDPEKRKSDISAIVCLCGCVAQFLTNSIVYSSYQNHTSGLEEHIMEQIQIYLNTAQVAITHISPLSPHSLRNVQALMFGALIAQETGDPLGSWNLNAIACNMAIGLNIHKQRNAYSHSPEAAFEARCALFFLYLNDKGLALNLGRPTCLPDSHLEIDLKAIPIATQGVWENLLLYLELAVIQGHIGDLQFTKAKLQVGEITRKASRISDMLDTAWELFNQTYARRGEQPTNPDAELERIMTCAAFHNTRTVALHSAGENGQSSHHIEACLESARLSMKEMNALHSLIQTTRPHDLRLHSCAHWTVLYYPFTPFFILFCNVIAKRHAPDFKIMQQFVKYLSSVQATSPPVKKLHNLCLSFCALAASVLNADEDPQNGETAKRRRLRSLSPDVQSRYYNQLETLSVSAQTETMTPVGAMHAIESERMQLGSPTTDAARDMHDNVSFNSIDDEFLLQLMDTQPNLQWLDSDFLNFERTWVYEGQGYEQNEGLGFRPFQ